MLSKSVRKHCQVIEVAPIDLTTKSDSWISGWLYILYPHPNESL